MDSLETQNEIWLQVGFKRVLKTFSDEHERTAYIAHSAHRARLLTHPTAW